MQRRLLAGACAGMAATLVSPVLGRLGCLTAWHKACMSVLVACVVAAAPCGLHSQPLQASHHRTMPAPPHHASFLPLPVQLTYPLDTLRLRLAVDPNLRGVRGAVAVLLREGSGAAFYRGLGASMLGALGHSHAGAAAAFPSWAVCAIGWLAVDLWSCARRHAHLCCLHVLRPPAATHHSSCCCPCDWCAGIGPYMALELTSYDLLPQSLPSFARGFAAAFIATVSCYPLDTIRRHIQLQVRGGERGSMLGESSCRAGVSDQVQVWGREQAPHPAAGALTNPHPAAGTSALARLPCPARPACAAPNSTLLPLLSSLPPHRRAAQWPSTWRHAPFSRRTAWPACTAALYPTR